jgi:hypothetical protein
VSDRDGVQMTPEEIEYEQNYREALRNFRQQLHADRIWHRHCEGSMRWKLSITSLCMVVLLMAVRVPAQDTSRFFNPQSGSGSPNVAPVSCTPSSSNLAKVLYWDTRNFVWYYCSATNSWTKFGSGTIAGTATAGQVAFGTGANAIGSDGNFVWDNTTHKLTIGPGGTDSTSLFLQAANQVVPVLILGNATIDASVDTLVARTIITGVTGHKDFEGGHFDAVAQGASNLTVAAGDNPGSVTGVVARGLVDDASHVDEVYGLLAIVGQFTNTASAMNAYGVLSSALNNGIQNTANYARFYGQHSSDSAGSAANVTNSYGLLLDNVDEGTNNRAIKTGLGLVEFGDALALDPITVAALPAAAAGNKGWMRTVSDSTAVASEGQTCVGGGTATALAFSTGSVWKCF